MSDIKRAFEKAGVKGTGGGDMKKKCKVCSKPLKDDSRFDTCYECGQKNKKEGGEDSDSLPPNYITKLDNGYFDSSGYLWEEFITTMASDVAKSFGKKLKNHQLRRFYGHAKAAENRLRMTEDWDSVNLDVKKLCPFASEAKGKDKIPQSFFDFIDKNITSIKIQKDFEKGFMEHFQAIVAYFTYHYPKN